MKKTFIYRETKEYKKQKAKENKLNMYEAFDLMHKIDGTSKGKSN